MRWFAVVEARGASLPGRRSRQTAGGPKAQTCRASRSGERAYEVGAVARLRGSRKFRGAGPLVLANEPTGVARGFRWLSCCLAMGEEEKEPRKFAMGACPKVWEPWASFLLLKEGASQVKNP